MSRIAVVGLGRRLREMWRRLREVDQAIRLVAVAEPDRNRALQSLRDLDIPADQVRIHPSADHLLEYADQYDAVMIGTRCHLHAEIAVQVAATGLPLFLEKPVAITARQADDLAHAFRGHEDRVFVSFPLRFTPLFARALDILRTGRLGVINQVQAWNNVPYGGVYFGEWYRNYEQSGGLFLQKATHDFDYINQLVNAAPQRIAATTSQTIFRGDMPHDLMCSECHLTDTCMESPTNITIRGDGGGAAHHHPDDKNHWCLFSRDIQNEDAGSALIVYANGTHANYTQNFASRRSAGRRGAIITGYTGTLQFDWFTETVKYIDHHTPLVEEYAVPAGDGHMGGDHRMLSSFLSIVRDHTPSECSLADGLLSVSMCLAARKSAQCNTFEPVRTAGQHNGRANHLAELACVEKSHVR